MVRRPGADATVSAMAGGAQLRQFLGGESREVLREELTCCSGACLCTAASLHRVQV